MNTSKNKHLKTGNYGEKLACEYLKKKKFSIIEKNYRFKRAEIDIIAADGHLILFVEVKTRSRVDFGYPEEVVSQKKADLIHMIAEHYVEKNAVSHDIRFDIIAVHLGSEIKIEHFEDAF